MGAETIRAHGDVNLERLVAGIDTRPGKRPVGPLTGTSKLPDVHTVVFAGYVHRVALGLARNTLGSRDSARSITTPTNHQPPFLFLLESVPAANLCRKARYWSL